MHLYSAFIVYCCAPKALYNHVGGGFSSTTTSVQHPLGWCDGCHRTTASVRSPQLQVERRERHRANQVEWGLLGGHDWQGPVEGIWQRHWGYTPTLYKKCHGIFNDHRESGPRFNVSSERRVFIWQSLYWSLYWGVRTHTDCRVSIPCWSH